MKSTKELLDKAIALEALHRNPNSPRGWAMRLIENKATMDQVPAHMKGIVGDHIATHEMHVQTASDHILALPNGKARLEAFNALTEALRPFVRDRIHKIKGEKRT